MRVELLTVGRELLIGRTVNTNAYWAGERLASMGGSLKMVTTVDDELGEISRALKEALARRPGVLVLMGGLGPTPDDMTLEGVAMGLGRKLQLDRKALQMIKAHYLRRGLAKAEVTPARRKMAMLPEGSVPVKNPVGTAPAVRLEAGGTVLFCLPGVPGEMKQIFTDSVEPELRKMLGRVHRETATLEVRGVLESEMAPMISEILKKHPRAYLKSHPRGVEDGLSKIIVDIASVGRSRAATEKEAEAVASEVEKWVRGRGDKVKRAGPDALGGEA